MMWQLWLAGGLGFTGIACGLSFWLWLRGLSRAAAQAAVDKQQNQTTSEVLHDVQEAKTIRERLVADPTYRERVRRKFTRSEP
jgi:hypothetical protein